MLQDLITQANEHVVKVNRLCKELEEFEGINHVADMEDSIVALGHSGNMTTYIGTVLSPKKMAELKQRVVTSLTEARIEKENELQKLMGLRKAATVNPVFEEAVQDMVNSAAKSEPVSEVPVKMESTKSELTVEAVRKMYIDEGKTLTETAAFFGVKKDMLNSFIRRNKLNRTSYGKDDGFRDAVVEQRRKERP